MRLEGGGGWQRRSAAARLTPPSALPRQLLDDLDEVEALLEDGEEEEARLLLDDLDRRYPRNEHVRSLLVRLAHDQQDMETYQYAVEQLLRITPNDATLALGLLAAYISNGRPALAIRTARSFLDQWPDHSEDADVRKVVSGVESFLPMLAKTGFDGPDALELAAQHEESNRSSIRGAGRRRGRSPSRCCGASPI